MKYPIPDSVLDGRLAFMGIAGSGKTTAAKGGVERLLSAGKRVCVVDLTGAWWGLRLKRDGKREAYPVVIFGGRHGDLPLMERSGALIGRTVAESSESTIISLEDLDGDAARRRFAKDFFDALHKANKSALTLVIDEADFYAPQNPVNDGPGPLLLNRIKEIASRGRIRGFRIWLISQRPQKLHKDALTQADTLIAMQLVHNRDRKAIDDWIADNAGKISGGDMISGLPSLNVGEGVIWSPRNDILLLAGFPMPDTYDSSSTPEFGSDEDEVRLKPIDIGSIRSKIGKVETEAKSNDPKELKRRIADLERQIQERDASASAADIAKQIIDARNAVVAEFGRIINEANFAARIGAAAAEIVKEINDGLGRLEEKAPEKTRSPKARPAAAASPQSFASPQESAAGGGGLDLKPALQKCLDALAWWESVGKSPVQRSLAAVVAGYSPKASTFGVYVAELISMGLVESSPGAIALTAEGRACAAFPRASDRNDLRNLARAMLGNQEQKIFDVVYEAYPREISRRDVAVRVGLSPTASTCGVYIAAVAGYGMIEPASRGAVRAADWLFI